MFQMKMNRTGLGVALVGITLAASSVAFAQGGGEHRCSGEQSAKTPEERAQHAAERFQKADKTVNAVFVNIEQGRIYEKTLTIPRK